MIPTNDNNTLQTAAVTERDNFDHVLADWRSTADMIDPSCRTEVLPRHMTATWGS